MFPQNNIVLIGNALVSQSKSLLNLKKRIINIDSFNDADLIGENYLNPDPQGKVNKEVISIIKNLKLEKEDTLIITSSEYENNEDYFNELKNYGYPLGNSQSTIKDIYDHTKIFKKLKNQNIKFPEKILDVEIHNKNFIKKNFHTSGGLGIKKNEASENSSEDDFYQNYIEGDSYSVIFICHNEEFSIIGINKIFSKKTKFSDFTFSGAYSNINLNKEVINSIEHMIYFFVKNYKLVGINGIDFILSDDVYFLEINPRITQTCFMYDNSFSSGFLNAHIEACIKKNNEIKINKNKSYFGFETIFANTSFDFNIETKDLGFLMNIPKQNTFIEVGYPICTICSESNTNESLKASLFKKLQFIKNKLKNIEII